MGKKKDNEEIKGMEDRVRTGETVYVDAEGNPMPTQKTEEKEVEENATA
mgnify:CR=1 FL=1